MQLQVPHMRSRLKQAGECPGRQERTELMKRHGANTLKLAIILQ